LFCCSLVRANPTDSTAAQKIQVHAVRLQEPIVIDGILSEAVWHNEFAFTDFKQSDPDQGSPGTQRTEVRVAYDDAAIYIGARMYDSSPDSIMPILSRRDQYPVADWFGVFIDAYHDQRTGNLFALSAGGSVIDGVMYNDDWNDLSWDGVWEGKTHIDDKGWTAEIRIPYSSFGLKTIKILCGE